MDTSEHGKQTRVPSNEEKYLLAKQTFRFSKQIHSVELRSYYELVSDFDVCVSVHR